MQLICKTFELLFEDNQQMLTDGEQAPRIRGR